MRPIGYSDKMFYYNGSGKTLTYDFQMRILLTSPPNKEALRRAAKKSLAVFPEFAVRPVIYDGKFFYEENDADIAIFDDNDQSHSLGSDETNGYLMCLICGERHVILSFYHGLADFVGNWSFICTLLYHYAHELGFNVEPAEVARLTDDAYRNMDPIERDDPYSKFGDENAVPTWTYKSSGAFTVPEKFFASEADILRSYDVEISVVDMIEISRKYQTSFTPLMIVVTARALKNIYDTKNLPIVAKMPVNMRPVFNTNTPANFSDSVILTYTDDMDNLDVAECCRLLKSSLKAQLKPENFAATLVKKKNRILGYEADGTAPELIAQKLATTPSSRPLTFAMTYPGILKLPVAYKSVVRDFNMEPYVPIEGFFLFVGAYDDNRLLRIRCCQRFDSDGVARAIAAQLDNIGFKTAFKDSGTLRGDKVYIDKFKHSSLLEK